MSSSRDHRARPHPSLLHFSGIHKLVTPEGSTYLVGLRREIHLREAAISPEVDLLGNYFLLFMRQVIMSPRVNFRLEVKCGLLYESGRFKALRGLRLRFGTRGYGFIDGLPHLLYLIRWVLRLLWGGSKKDNSSHGVLSQITR